MKQNRRIPLPELWSILRAADDLIGRGGRTLLTKILKGSRERKLLELGLDRNPSYGFYKDLTLEEIKEKVEHMIDTGFLEIELNGKLPVIVFSQLGWVVERDRRAEEFLREWDLWIANNVTPMSMEYLKERNRGMIFLFLYKILCTGDKKYIPYLTLWERVDFRKVQAEIRNVIEALERREQMDDEAWSLHVREVAQTLLVRPKKSIIMECPKCGYLFVFDESNPDYYTKEGLRLPEICDRCEEDPKWHRRR